MTRELVQTSFRLSPDLLEQVKAAAAIQNRTLSGEIVTALQAHMVNSSGRKEAAVAGQ